MTDVAAFKGLRYDVDRVGSLGAVLCPPYDVINEEQQEDYYNISPYNAIRLEHPLTSGCGTHKNRYESAAEHLRAWLEEGVLSLDANASLYIHDQHFVYRGHSLRRRALLARVRLRQWYEGIYPHEETFTKAKQDRLELIRACRTNFSPLLALYEDPNLEIAEMCEQTVGTAPLVEVWDGGEGHVLWAMREPHLIQRVCSLMSGQPLYIADGHHRYETALRYCREQMEEGRADAGVNWVLMDLVPFSDPGLVIYPVHRLVRGMSSSELESFEARIDGLFSVEYVPVEQVASSGQWRLPRGVLMGVLGLSGGDIALLHARQGVDMAEFMPIERSPAYRSFNVSLLNHVILDKIPSLAHESDSISHTPDAQEVHNQVARGSYQLGFVLPSPQPDTVKAFADARDRMPRKSTYFYPKPPAGLVMNMLDS